MQKFSRPLDNPPEMTPSGTSGTAPEIPDESEMVTPKASPSKAKRGGGVFISPTRARNASSISMFEVPDHMVAGQFLPDREEGGLAAAPWAFGRLDEGNDLPDSELEDRASLFPYEVGVPEERRLSTVDPKANTEDNWEEEDSSSDDDGFGGAPIFRRTVIDPPVDHAPIVRDFAVEKNSRHLRPDAFPEYDDAAAMDLLQQPEEVPAMPIRPRGQMVDNDFVLIEEDVEPVQRSLRHRNGRARQGGLLRRFSPTKEEPEEMERGRSVEGSS